MTDATDDAESNGMIELTYCSKHPGRWPHECTCGAPMVGDVSGWPHDDDDDDDDDDEEEA